MRAAVWVALAALALGLGAGFAGRAADAQALDVVGGLALLAAAGALLTLLPWRRWVPLEPMPGLFPAVGAGQRWCEACGSVAGTGACAACGDDPRPAATRGRRPTKAGTVRKGATSPATPTAPEATEGTERRRRPEAKAQGPSPPSAPPSAAPRKAARRKG